MDDLISTQLAKFGLDNNHQQVYLALLETSSLGATELSKRCRIPKTSIYRTLEELKQKKLITEIVAEYRRTFAAESPDNLRYQLVEKQAELQTLEETLPSLLNGLSALSKTAPQKPQVKYYSGLDGLKQVTWNSSKAVDILRIFEIKNMSAFMNFDFAELTRKEFVKNRVVTHELSIEEEIPGWTNVTEMVRNYWKLRYIDPKELAMKFEMLVYNDVFTMYNYQNKDIFCVEIYNQDLADMQKQIFDFIWNKGREYTILDDHGAARVNFT